MKAPYQKSILFILVWIAQTIAFSAMAQLTPLDNNLSELPGYSFSKKHGVMAKLTKIPSNNQQSKAPFYANSFKDKKHGLQPYKNTGEQANRDTGFEYLEHVDTGMNIPFAATTDTDGNTYITGSASSTEKPIGQFITIKLDPQGELVWEKRMEATDYTAEFGMELLLDQNQNPIVSGVRWNGNNMDLYTIKYSADNGNEIWSTIYDSGHQAMEVPTAITMTDSGELIVAGITYTGTSVEYMVVKYSPLGELLWDTIDTNPIQNTWNEPTSIATDIAGNIAVTGYAAVDGTSEGYWQGYLTIRYNSNGEQQWRMPYLYERLEDENNPSSELINTHSIAEGVSLDANGNTYVTGAFDKVLLQRAGTIKYDENGTEEWINIYRAGEEDDHLTNGLEIETTPNNIIYVAGRHRDDWTNEGTILISYNEDGTENWVDEKENLIQIRTAKLLLDKNDLPIVSGIGYDEGTFDDRIRVFRFSETGEVLKETSYLKLQSPTEGIREYINVSLDDSENIYVVLDNFYTAKGGVFETVKLPFDSGDNNPEWSHIYETPLSKSGTRMLTTTHHENNMYATGDFNTIENNQLFPNFFVSKYNEDGTVAWQKIFNEQNDNASNGIIARVNQQGELIVILIPNPSSSYPIRLKKYTPEGELIWETEKEIENALLRAFFLDEAGNIYISGNSKEDPADQSPVFTTIKYNGEGEELWTRYETTDNPYDFVFEINDGAGTEEGDIILTGVSGTATMFGEDVDLTAIKYNNSGELQWVNKYPQPDFNSAGFNLILDADNNAYISGGRQEPIHQVEDIVTLKLDTNGEVVWKTTYGQSDEGRLMRPYKIMTDSNGNIVIPSYSLYFVQGQPTNNRITTIQLEKESGVLNWVHNTELEHYYSDSYIDHEDNLYLYGQAGFITYKRLTSAAIGGNLIRIDSNGQNIGEEEVFFNDELALFYPNSLTPLDNGTLVLGGHLNHELSFFSGLYFFESEHVILGIDDNPIDEDSNANWIGQNYPNPTSGITKIPFFLNSSTKVNLTLYDLQGRSISQPLSKIFPAGNNTLQVNVSGLQTGVYFYQIEAGNFKKARKIIVK